ncbi:MAG: cyclopropane-fatty-acyl-phospholipid synthase family protein, partial [Thermoguttaceae bacterium]
ETPRRQAVPSHRVDRWLAQRILVAVGVPGIRIVLWDGEEVSIRDAPPSARIMIHDRPTLLRLIANANLHFGDAYASGRLELEGDLLEFLISVHRARPTSSRGASMLLDKIGRLLHLRSVNTRCGSRHNIHRHYDIGNDFYKLWLDREMVYSCAYFTSPDISLDEAQLAKMDYVCRKLWLQPGETVVEVGSGWGAMALYMARRYGVKVKAFNICRSQISFARERAAREGLDSRVEFIEDDYRNISGSFDALVSLGMLEHVGAEHYRDYGKMIDRCLGPNGRGLVQTIGQNRAGPINSWIDRRIFPGAYPPSMRQMADFLDPWKLSVLDLENLRLHYARTLGRWRDRFDSWQSAVAAMFDDRFVRMWRLYLNGSIAAFTAGGLQLFQVTFARPGLNAVPWTRSRLYAGETNA